MRDAKIVAGNDDIGGLRLPRRDVLGRRRGDEEKGERED
jgi:hypothetical protein